MLPTTKQTGPEDGRTLPATTTTATQEAAAGRYFFPAEVPLHHLHHPTIQGPILLLLQEAAAAEAPHQGAAVPVLLYQDRAGVKQPLVSPAGNQNTCISTLVSKKSGYDQIYTRTFFTDNQFRFSPGT